MIGPSNKTPYDYLCNPNENSFYLSLSCKEDIEDIISTIRTDTACGPSSIPTRILKGFKKELSKPLSDVIKISFSSGIFPDSMKLAKVVPAYKKTTNLTAATTGQPCYYQTWANSLKNKFIRN